MPIKHFQFKVFSNKKWHKFCLLSQIMMVQWFDEVERHHQVKVMGKPKAAREMDILQTSTFLSFLTTGEPHTRPCEVVQGSKMYSSWFWLFLAVCSSWAGQQCCVGLVSWCLQKGHWKNLCVYGVWAQLENEKQMAWSFSALISLFATKHIPTPLCCSWAQCWFKGEPFSAPQPVLQSSLGTFKEQSTAWAKGLFL